LSLVGCSSAPAQPDPLQVRLDDLDARLGRVEGVVNNQSLTRLSERIDVLEGQLRELRGSIEELQNSTDSGRKQQRDLYADLDKRLAALESATKSVAADVAASDAGAGAAGGEQSAYSRAFDRLKSHDYAGAVEQFRDFLKTYPTSTLADNAQYWLGEAYFVTHDYDSAVAAFRAVNPESRKAADALVGLANTQIEQKHYADARANLNTVLQRYPGTDAAKLASDRLQKLPVDAH
jgi:tol-pal system protein YbgF